MSSSGSAPGALASGPATALRHTAFTRFTWGLIAYTLAVILWGAWVRVTGSGAGCGEHWPTCNGQVIPRPEALETVIEFAHRVTSASAGLLVLALVVWAFRAFPRGHGARAGAVASFGLIVLEGAVGAVQVRLGLTADNASLGRAIIQPIHFANTFLLLAALYFTAAASAGFVRLRGQGRTLWGALLGTGLLTLVLGATGAVTALGDTLFPSGANESLLEGVRKTFDPASNFLLQLRVIHPALALGFSVVLVALVAWLSGTRAGQGTRSANLARAGGLSLGLLGAQMLAGVLTLLLKAPEFMQLTHLTLACLMWLAVLHLFRATLETAPDRRDVPGSAPSGVGA